MKAFTFPDTPTMLPPTVPTGDLMQTYMQQAAPFAPGDTRSITTGPTYSTPAGVLAQSNREFFDRRISSVLQATLNIPKVNISTTTPAQQSTFQKIWPVVAIAGAGLLGLLIIRS